MLRRCSKCLVVQNESEFHRCNNRATKFQSQCKTCKKKKYLETRIEVLARAKKFRQQHPKITKQRKQKYYQTHKVEIRASQKLYCNKPSVKQAKRQADRIYRQRHRRKLSKYFREKHLLKAYNLTQAGYDKLYQQQQGKCAICSRWQLRLDVDHNHTTNKIRALLCGECNRAIGLLQDSSKVCMNASRYLKKHGI